MTKQEYEFLKSNSQRRSVRLKQLQNEMDCAKMKAQSILESFEGLDMNLFKRYFFNELDIQKIQFTNTIKSAFEILIEEYRVVGKTTETYCNAMARFIEFSGKDFLLENINENWLNRFRDWYLKKGFSRSSASIYFRCLRRVFKYHMEKGNIPEKKYPFEKFKIQSTTKAKSALMPNEVQKFWDYQPQTKAQQQAKDLWFMSYLGNGANPADIFALKCGDIHDESIVFYRKKTINTEEKLTPIIIPLIPQIIDILERQNYKNKGKDDYVFPYYEKGKDNNKTLVEIRKDERKRTNRVLKRINNKLKLSQPLILKNARHSFATKVYLDGNGQYIQSMMGHSSMETTGHYIATLPVSQTKEASEKLLDFDTKKKNKKIRESLSDRFIPESEMAVIKDGKLIRNNGN